MDVVASSRFIYCRAFSCGLRVFFLIALAKRLNSMTVLALGQRRRSVRLRHMPHFEILP
jgi:hypothetical protein